MPKNILSLLAVTVAWLALTSCGIGGESSPQAILRTSSDPLTNQDWDRAVSEPNSYVGSKVELQGQIFYVIGEQDGAFRFQMFTDPEARQGNTHVEWGGDTAGLKEGVDVVVKGTFKEMRVTSSMAGTELRIPAVLADSVDIVSPEDQVTPQASVTPTTQPSPTPAASPTLTPTLTVAPLEITPTPRVTAVVTATAVPSPTMTAPLTSPTAPPSPMPEEASPTAEPSPTAASPTPVSPTATPQPATATPHSAPSPSPTSTAVLAPLDVSPAATVTPTAAVTATPTPIPSTPNATPTPLRTPSPQPGTPTTAPAPTREVRPTTPTTVPPTPYSIPSPTQPPATPTAIPAPTQTPTPAPVVEYTVKQGDTLSQIAARYGVDMDAIARYNGISSPDDIKIGQKITIPTSTVPAPTPALTSTPSPQSVTTYTVKVGDTLSEIAQKYGVDVDVIIRYNGISSPDELQVGQTIAIPLNTD